MRNYNPAVDATRGFAIVLVIVGHVIQYGNYQELYLKSLYSLIYSFHMPLFFFIAGLVFDPERRFSYPLIINKFGRLLIPWLLWSALILIFSVALGCISVVRSEALYFYWFLPVIFSSYLILHFGFAFVAKGECFTRGILVALIILAVLFMFDGFWFSSIRYHSLFMLGGVFVARYFPGRFGLPSVLALAFVTAFVGVMAFAYDVNSLIGNLGLIGFPVRVALAFLLTFSIFSIIAGTALGKSALLIYVGRRSLQFYLIHLLLLQLFCFDGQRYPVLLMLCALMLASHLIARAFERLPPLNRYLFGGG